MSTSLKALVAALTLVAGSTVFAETSGKNVITEPRPVESRAETAPSIAIKAGMTDTNNGRRNGTGYGVEYGFQPYIPFGAAVELSGYVSDHKGSEATLTRTKLLAKANYNFGGSIPVIKNSYVGLGIGGVYDNVANKTDLEFGIAPQVGFDIPIANSQYSLGADADYLFVGGAKPDVFAVNGVAKYWF